MLSYCTYQYFVGQFLKEVILFCYSISMSKIALRSFYKRFYERSYKYGLIAAIVVLSIASIVVTQQKQAFGSANGRVVFTGQDTLSNSQIYSIQPDGSDEQQLTNDSYGHRSPSWSPDGSEIIYSADVNADGIQQIMAMNADGSNQHAVTNDPLFFSDEPVWSPDGSKIAFVGAPSDFATPPEIYTMDIDGSNRVQVTHNAESAFYASWNPDGNSLLYTCGTSTFTQLCTVHTDGSGETQLTRLTEDALNGAWSPDGSQIAFISSATGYVQRITVMNADTSNQHVLTTSNTDNQNVSWSPDGTKLLYDDYSGGVDNLRYIHVDGSGETTIPTSSNQASGGRWQSLGGTDTDNDGSTDAVEIAGPNNGDANGDGIADKYQAKITSIVNPLTHEYVVLQSSCTSNKATTVMVAPADHTDSGFSYAQGLLNFTLSCVVPNTTATVTQYYYGLPTSTILTLRKYNSSAHTYQTVPGATLTSATIGGKTLTKVTYQIKDGGPLDQDGLANGVIVDPVGVAQPTASAPNTGLGGMAATL
jgi:Tol biopolymer transport system component